MHRFALRNARFPGSPCERICRRSVAPSLSFAVHHWGISFQVVGDRNAGRITWPQLADLAFGLGAQTANAGPSPGAATHGAFRQAGAGDGRDSTHSAGQPTVVELQGAAQIGALAAVGVMPCGGQRGQFLYGMDVARPAVPQLVAGVVLTQHGIGPPPQLGELGTEGMPVQADPVGRSGAAGRGCV